MERSSIEDNRVKHAVERAEARYGQEVWIGLEPSRRTAAIYSELCRLDSGCQRTGGKSDKRLAPCLANDSFRLRRGCTAG